MHLSGAYMLTECSQCEKIPYAFGQPSVQARPSSHDRGAGEGEQLQPSVFGLSSETVTLSELERVTKSMSSHGFPHTDAWMELFGNLGMHDPSLNLIAGQQIANLRIPIHLMQPLWQDDDAPVNRVISDYRSAARRQITQGNPAVEILDMGNIDVAAFFQPRNSLSFPTVSEWASEINKCSADVDIIVRLANVLLQTHLMRVRRPSAMWKCSINGASQWLIQPSMENYNRMPEMIRPTQLQMLYPHMAAISTIPL